MTGQSAKRSAGQLCDGAKDILITRRSVDAGRFDALVSGDALHESYVTRSSIEIRERCVARRVQAEVAIEPRSRLPEPEHVPERPCRDALPSARDEERRVGGEALTLSALPADELGKLVPRAVGQEDVLVDRLLARTLEDSQRESASNSTIAVQDVADIETSDFVFAQGGAKCRRDDDVVSEPSSVLTCHLEQSSLFEDRERSWGADNGENVRGHEQSSLRELATHTCVELPSTQAQSKGSASAQKKWSRYFKECQSCGTTSRRHGGRGLCIRCYMNLRARGTLPEKREYPWSSDSECCRSCATTDREHAAKGLCIDCYARARGRLPEVRQAERERRRRHTAIPLYLRPRRPKAKPGPTPAGRRGRRAYRERLAGVHVRVPLGYEELVWSVFGRCCAYCGSPEGLALDHHRPLRAGYALLHNAVPLCRSCNSKKSNKTPERFYDAVRLAEIESMLCRVREAFSARFGNEGAT